MNSVKYLSTSISIAAYLIGLTGSLLSPQSILAQVNAPVDPRLDQILVDWEQKTAGIRKLSGNHRRFLYDSVFEVEKRADGQFYYESPDKGRIDIKAVKLDPKEVSQRTGKTGKPYEIQTDIPQIWICDGSKIAQAEVSQETYQTFPIPKEQRGQNIMDGPLPFLFGLPADVAKQRYRIQVLKQTNEQFVWLQLFPNRQQDLENWSSAQVILDRKTYLPFAVRMTAPGGNRETVYRFENLKVNGIVIPIFGRDPFEIKSVLKGYKEIKSGLQDVQTAGNTAPGKRPMVGPQTQATPRQVPAIPTKNVTVKPAKSIAMPDVSNYPWKTLKKFFEQKGFNVDFRKANPAPTPEKVFAIAAQHPKAGEPLQPGQTVTFWLYDEIKTAAKPE